MREGQKESPNGRTETLPRTARRMAAEEAAGADSEEAGMSEQGSSAVDECVCSLTLRESQSSAETPGHLAGFYHFQLLPVVLQTVHVQKVDSQRP